MIKEAWPKLAEKEAKSLRGKGQEMIIIRSTNHVPIRRTTKRWSHIIRRHPATDGQRDRVLETITNPEMIQEGEGAAKAKITLDCQIVATVLAKVLNCDSITPTAGRWSRSSRQGCSEQRRDEL